MPDVHEGTRPETSWQQLVVVGGSAGAISALRTLCGSLPAAFPAPVLVAVHVPSTPSVLPRILDRSGRLPADVAKDQQELLPGAVYVAAPGRHLRVAADGRAHLDDGPRERGHRPAIDPLFRSAADAFGDRVIAVVLSGSGDDGTQGARQVAMRGGTVLVQDPDEAVHGSMPRSVVQRDHAHSVLGVADIATALIELVDGTWPARPLPMTRRKDRRDASSAVPRLSEIDPGLEPTLGAAIRLFEHRAMLLRNLAARAGTSGRNLGAAHFTGRADEALERAEILRQFLKHPAMGRARVREAPPGP